MQLRVSQGVKDGQQNETGCADGGKGDGEPGEDLLRESGVGHEPAPVPQPAVREEGDVEEDGGDGAAGDEERLQLLRAHVADVCD